MTADTSPSITARGRQAVAGEENLHEKGVMIDTILDAGRPAAGLHMGYVG